MVIALAIHVQSRDHTGSLPDQESEKHPPFEALRGHV